MTCCTAFTLFPNTLGGRDSTVCFACCVVVCDKSSLAAEVGLPNTLGRDDDTSPDVEAQILVLGLGLGLGLGPPGCYGLGF